jgi:hypothetical protein
VNIPEPVTRTNGMFGESNSVSKSVALHHLRVSYARWKSVATSQLGSMRTSKRINWLQLHPLCRLRELATAGSV